MLVEVLSAVDVVAERTFLLIKRRAERTLESGKTLLPITPLRLLLMMQQYTTTSAAVAVSFGRLQSICAAMQTSASSQKTRRSFAVLHSDAEDVSRLVLP